LVGAELQAHARVRRLTGRIFTAEQTGAFAHFIRTTAEELIDRVSAQGRCELVSALAAPLPIAVIALILGIDGGWTEKLRRWSTAILHLGDASYIGSERQAFQGDVRECRAFLRDHI